MLENCANKALVWDFTREREGNRKPVITLNLLADKIMNSCKIGKS
jgi:hypothetical protein